MVKWSEAASSSYFTGEDGAEVSAAYENEFLASDVSREGFEYEAYSPFTTPGFDCTISAPKSVSVALHLAAEDALRNDMKQSHREAVIAVQEAILNEKVLTYKDNSGVGTATVDISAKDVDSVLAVNFEHNLSRANEPQLHTHVVFVNGFQGVTGEIFEMSNHRAFSKLQGVLTQEYHSALEAALNKRGYETYRQAGYVQLSGIDKEICEMFSTRSKQVAKFKEEGGDVRFAALKTRDEKEDVDLNTLTKGWVETAGMTYTQQLVQIQVQQQRQIQQ